MSDTNSDLSIDPQENDIFIGEYVGDRSPDGKRDGVGRAILPNRDQYEGDYRKGLRDGNGIYHFRNGARYEGEWKKGAKHGRGKFTYPDGSSYIGDWKLNMKHGFGTYSYENGDVFEGTWMNDVKHGVGTYKFNEAEITIKGTWFEGNLKGPIEVVYLNFRYHGYWNNFYPVGDGVFSFGTHLVLPGHIDFFPNPEFLGENHCESSKTDSKSSKVDSTVSKSENENALSEKEMKQFEKNQRCLPAFVAHRIESFDYSRLPQHPIILPTADSVSTIFTGSSKSDVEVYQVQLPILITADPIEVDEKEYE